MFALSRKKTGKLYIGLFPNSARWRGGEKLEVVAFHPEKDEEIAKDIAQYLGCHCVILSHFSQIIPYFEKLKAVFTLRLHPAILATLLDIPWFALNLDPKIQAFSRWWEEENLLSFSELEENKLGEIYWKKML